MPSGVLLNSVLSRTGVTVLQIEGPRPSKHTTVVVSVRQGAYQSEGHGYISSAC